MQESGLDRPNKKTDDRLHVVEIKVKPLAVMIRMYSNSNTSSKLIVDDYIIYIIVTGEEKMVVISFALLPLPNVRVLQLELVLYIDRCMHLHCMAVRWQGDSKSR